MIVGMILIGVLSGAFGVAWAASSSLSLWLVLLAYPLAGVLGAVAFLALAMMRPATRSAMIPMGAAQNSQ